MLSPDTLLQNRYLILRLLARGGMGAVYEARDERLGNIVALKETLFVDEAMRIAFHREASILATLRHQALPKVIDHFTEGDGQFLVMEYIRGEDLSMILRINGSPIPPVDALAWAGQALVALEYLHSQRPPVIHRDIKPQNLKLNERGEVILLDFGLAKEAVLDTTRAPRSVRGYTLNYAPLEQIQGTGTDPRSDIYSLAATFYHLMTGVVPPNAVVRATALIEGREDPLRPAHELNTQISRAVSDVLERALTLDRNHRPASAAALRAELQQSARAEAVKASSTQTRVQPAVIKTSPAAVAPVTQPYWNAPAANSQNFDLPYNEPRKRRAWVWLACAAAVAIAAISSITLFSWNRTNETGPVASTKINPDPSPEAPKGNLVSSHVILGDGSESNRDHSFIAEPGEFKLTLDVLSKWGNGSSVTVEAIGENGLMRFAGEKTKLSLSSDGEHEQAVARLVVERAQLVRLRVTKGKNLEAFRLRIDGSAILKDEAAPGAEKSTLAALFANRDRPLPLVEHAVFAGPGGKKETYYAFTAGPGEIKLTLNVIGDDGTISAEIFNDEAERLPFAGGSKRLMVSSSRQINEEESASLSLERPQRVLLRIYNATPQKIRAFRVQIDGRVQLVNRNKANSTTDVAEDVKALFAPRDSPEALTSKEISDRAIERESYFTFAAGPGTVRLNLEVEANGSTLKVELFDSQSKRLRFNDNSPVFSLSSNGKKEKKSSEITLGREENLLMRLSANPPDSLNKFRLKLDGAVKKR